MSENPKWDDNSPEFKQDQVLFGDVGGKALNIDDPLVEPEPERPFICDDCEAEIWPGQGWRGGADHLETCNYRRRYRDKSKSK